MDIETTGLSPQTDKIIEIGAIKVKGEECIGYFSELINPQIDIPYKITGITGITNNMVKDAKSIDIVMNEFIEYAEGFPIIGHNVSFDYSFLKTNANNLGYTYEKYGLDTLKLARLFIKDLQSKSLSSLCDYYGIKNKNAHRAYEDAHVTNLIFNRIKESYYEDNQEAFQPKKMDFKVKKQELITIKQKSYLNNLLKYHKIDMKQSIDILTKSEASKEIDRIIRNYGRIS